MEEVDDIIIHSLKQIGCEFEDEVQCIKHFKTEDVVESCARCIKTVKPDSTIPLHLPPSMAARFKVGAAIAEELTKLGFPGEIGYQTILYSSESEIRNILLFLVEKLPKDNEKATDEPLGQAALLKQSLKKKILDDLNKEWVPSYCNDPESDEWECEPFESCSLQTPLDVLAVLKTLPKETMRSYCTILPWAHEQSKPSQFVPSVINWHSTSIHKEDIIQDVEDISINKFSDVNNKYKELIRAELRDHLSEKEAESVLLVNKDAGENIIEIQHPDATNTVVVPQEDALLVQSVSPAVVQMEISDLRKVWNSLQDKRRNLHTIVNQLAKQVKEAELVAIESESMAQLAEETKVLLQDPVKNIEQLELLVNTSSQRLISLAKQWEKHRTGLIQQIRLLKQEKSSRSSESQHLQAEVNDLQNRIQELTRDSKEKDEIQRPLEILYEKMAKDINRSAYTRRILEIIANIRKQTEEIDRVLLDTRQLQKEINQLSGKVERTYTVVDEIMFRDAKKDETVRQAYKFLATLHSDCAELIKIVEDTSSINREARDLEEQIEVEQAKKTTANLERIQADLVQMKQENAMLTQKIKIKR